MNETDNRISPGMPYKNEAANRIYDMLFCDNENLFRPDKKFISAYPWNILFSKKTDTAGLKKVIEDINIEPRIKLLACSRLLSSGIKPDRRELLGVVIEVGLEEGLDTLAAYRDGTARYINYSERMIFWDSPESDSKEIIDRLFQASENTLSKIGPWDKARLKFPAKGTARISFLVSDGLYFGQGSVDNFFSKNMSAPIIKYGSELMNYLIDKSSYHPDIWG